MNRKDPHASDLIRRLRTNEGLSRAALCHAILEKGVGEGFSANRVSVSADLIRLIEEKGHEPRERIKFAISLYFGLRPGHIWKRDALVEKELAGLSDRVAA